MKLNKQVLIYSANKGEEDEHKDAILRNRNKQTELKEELTAEELINSL